MARLQGWCVTAFEQLSDIVHFTGRISFFCASGF